MSNEIIAMIFSAMGIAILSMLGATIYICYLIKENSKLKIKLLDERKKI